MAISEIPIPSMLRTRMHWHQERQRLLAGNVANSGTPEFCSRDLAPSSFGSEFAQADVSRAVHIEDVMVKVAANRMDCQAASVLYARSLARIKFTLGKSS
jgi:flagellar basal-body rod protein FlgB